MTSRHRDAGRKYLSGCEKLKQRRKREEIKDKQKNSLKKFLIIENVQKAGETPNSQLLKNPNSGNDPDHNANCRLKKVEEGYKETEDNYETAGNSQVEEFLLVSNKEKDELFQRSQLSFQQKQQSDEEKNTDISDPGTWPDIITDKFRMMAIENGVTQVKIKLANGERQERRWLLYSKSKDATLCFACKLFSSNTTSLSSNGLNDWVHLSSRLQSHERSEQHLQAMYKLLKLEKSLKMGNTIDKEHEKLIEKEAQRLKCVCERIVAAILYLSEHNLAFRGSNDALYRPHNGHFLGLIELLARFDPILKQHLDRCVETSSHSYLSHRIQDELISVLAKKVRKEIINLVKKAKSTSQSY